MRVTVVGAGIAGLTAALALQRDGHEVAVFERAKSLRTTGFGLNLWSNATTLLRTLGVEVPGEPFDRAEIRSGGRVRTTMPLAARGAPHVDAERGAVLRSIAAGLSGGTVQHDKRIDSVADARARHDARLVVIADGAGSTLRPEARPARRRSRPWIVWQAVLDHGGDLLPQGAGSLVLEPGRFLGLWRQPNDGLDWFLEEPGLADDVDAVTVLDRLASSRDALVAEVAGRTPPESFRQWQARDRWPGRLAGEGFAVVGDAGHPLLPCLGQGACLAVEDAVALARCLREHDLPAALRRYEIERRRRARTVVALAHAACLARRPNPLAGLVSSTVAIRPFIAMSGAVLRTLATPRAG